MSNDPDRAELFTHKAREQMSETIGLIADERQGFIDRDEPGGEKFTDLQAIERLVKRGKKLTDVLKGDDELLVPVGRQRLVNSAGQKTGVRDDGCFTLRQSSPPNGTTLLMDLAFIRMMEEAGKDPTIALAIPF